jgi:hypothetical protein
MTFYAWTVSFCLGELCAVSDKLDKSANTSSGNAGCFRDKHTVRIAGNSLKLVCHGAMGSRLRQVITTKT